MVTHRDEHGHSVGVEPAEGKEQGLRGAGVEPVRIVDDDEQRRVVRGVQDQTKSTGCNREGIPGNGRPESQRALESGRLRWGKPIEPAEQRLEQLRQRREGELGFRLDAAGLEDGQPVGLLACVPEQSGLADPRVPTKHERAAFAAACPLEQPVDPAAFGRPPEQHERILCLQTGGD